MFICLAPDENCRAERRTLISKDALQRFHELIFTESTVGTGKSRVNYSFGKTYDGLGQRGRFNS
jgi:hypothetical protein